MGIVASRIPMDRGTWQATVYGVAESDTTELLTLSLFINLAFSKILEKRSGYTGGKQISVCQGFEVR